ncbi:MAG TPA: cytochrome P460 family protein [Terracidiphilus sp.]|jgi:mono/diheme cytochrome c family protein
MRPSLKRALACAGVFLAAQLYRPATPFSAPANEVQAPEQVKQVLRNRCYACHSNERRLAWFDYVNPAWLVARHDILTAREHLNFSTLGSKPPAAQKAALYESVNMIQLGAMPLPAYRWAHPGAQPTTEELATLKAYLAPWTTAPDQPAHVASTLGVKTDAAPAAVSPALRKAITAVRPEWNGLALDTSFESWKPLSFTDRGDNNTFRFVLGNDVAVKAAREGKIAPWPDGARFAKIAWQQQVGPDGLIHPGKFVQVEMMEKGQKRYKDALGWGWGRWRGLDLKPYGENSQFVNECSSCHLPMRGADFVYTLPITGGNTDRQDIVNAMAAAIPARVPVRPLEWSAITLLVDPKQRTIAALMGNDIALKAVNARADSPIAPLYPAGAELALVTWTEREDPHWFGGRIPSVVRSVEVVQAGAPGTLPVYTRYEGAALAEQRVAAEDAKGRVAFMTHLAPAAMP